MSSSRNTLRASVALITALMVAAGALRLTAAERAEINACALLTDKEVAGALGLAVEPARRDDAGWIEGSSPADKGMYSSTCLWKVSADRDANDPAKPLGGARFAILNAMFWPGGSSDTRRFLQSFRDAAKNHVIPHPPVDLKIGDEALWWGDGVAVRKGRISFGISVRLIADKAMERKKAEMLARKIAGRVGSLETGLSSESVSLELDPTL